MAKWMLLLCGFLVTVSVAQSGEPDEGGIGGTGVVFNAPDIPEVSEVPQPPEVPDGMDISVSGESLPTVDVPSADPVTSIETPSDVEVTH